jgi:hypothetical protein
MFIMNVDANLVGYMFGVESVIECVRTIIARNTSSLANESEY